MQNFLFLLMLTIRSVLKKSIRPSLSEPTLVVLALALCWMAPTGPTVLAGHSAQPAIDSTTQCREANAFAIRKVSTCRDEPRFDHHRNQISAAETGTFYRRTKNGWEDARKWQKRSEPIQKQMDAMHPFTWTLLVLGLVLLVLFGCSKQSEIDRLFTDLDSYFERDKSGP